ncbi:hypothetical protein ACHAW6_015853 [Cyclotella cf. meneghiniana]
MKRAASPSRAHFASSLLYRKPSASYRGGDTPVQNHSSWRFLHAHASIREWRLLSPSSNVCATLRHGNGSHADWRDSMCHQTHRALFTLRFHWSIQPPGGTDNHLDFKSRRYSNGRTHLQDKATAKHSRQGDNSTHVLNIPTNEQHGDNITQDSSFTKNSALHSQQQQQQQSTAQSIPSPPPIPHHPYLPPSLLPYAHLSRLDKPTGTYLLLHPCLWSTALASPLGFPPDPGLCALFAAGAFVMRGAGCTVNDMWDSDFDSEVERTKDRPLASGAVTHREAAGWVGVQAAVGLGVLVSMPHVEQCFVWGVASLPLVVTYPLMKRYTNYPQLVLGLTFNWGAIMGWVAVRGELDWSVVGPLYLSAVGWTMVYDTLYAHQDRVDDAKLGLKSTALTFGDRTKPILSMFTAATWALWMTAGYNCGYGLPWEAPYYYAGCSVAAAHLLWQVQSADLNDAENLAYRFRSNNLVGWIVFGSCAAGNMMAG